MSSENYRPVKKTIEPVTNMENDTQQPVNPVQATESQNLQPQIDDAPKLDIKGNVPEVLQNLISAKKNSQTSQSTGNVNLDNILSQINNNVYERIELPSRGVFYDGKNGPTDGVLHIRQMTGAEEQILSTPRLHKGGRAINMIFNQCIKEAYNSENFLSQDRTFLLIFLRGISYSPEYEVEIRDPDTNQTFMETINLDTDLNKTYCPEDFGPDNLTDELPKTKLNFTYKLPTGRDEQVLINYKERMNKDFQRSGIADDTLIYKHSMLIEEIAGLTNKNEIKTLLTKLPIQDLAYIRTLIDEPPFGVSTKVTIQNPYTYNEFTIDLPIDANFFLPRVKKASEG